jgi:uncharacterized membrane protein
MRKSASFGSRLLRGLRHQCYGSARARRRFSSSTLARLEQAVAAGEATHRGELRIVVESRLDAGALRTGLEPRGRALQVFAELGVWDTEENNGVLLYILLADRAVEIVADRAADRAIATERWAQVCAELTAEYLKGNWAEGTLRAVQAIHGLLAQAFPADREAATPDLDELPNRPLVR